MNEQDAQKAMELIFYSGNAKSMAMNALDLAESNEFNRAKETLVEAKAELHKSHQLQTDMMQCEIQGAAIEKSILLIHAQDHFMGAGVACDLIERLIRMYEQLYKLEEGNDGHK